MTSSRRTWAEGRGDRLRWSSESIADVAFADSEVALYGGREDREFLAQIDRLGEAGDRTGKALALGNLGLAPEARWRRQYHRVRPHSSLEYRPPAPEAWSMDEATPRTDRPVLATRRQEAARE